MVNEHMKWICISGSWRKTNKKIEADVRACVRKILREGNGIITGGALNVDYFATDEMLKINPTLDKLKIYLPSTFDIFATHFRRRAQEEVITRKQAEDLITLINRIININPSAIIENKTNKELNKQTYYERNTDEINASDELYAFQVNNSLGTEDTIKKAKEKGIPVKLFSYSI